MMNAYDLVVTVALGSTLASALLTKDVALADGALAFALLIGLQFIWGRSRQSCWRRTARPAWAARVRELAARAWKGSIRRDVITRSGATAFTKETFP